MALSALLFVQTSSLGLRPASAVRSLAGARLHGTTVHDRAHERSKLIPNPSADLSECQMREPLAFKLALILTSGSCLASMFSSIVCLQVRFHFRSHCSCRCSFEQPGDDL